MAIGRGTGDNRCIDAARQAIESPLLEISIEGAKGVLFNVTGGTDLGMLEVHEAASVIQQAADPEANIIFGAVIDPEMGNDVKITLIATGFDSARRNDARMNFVQRDSGAYTPGHNAGQQGQQPQQGSGPLRPMTDYSGNGQSRPSANPNHTPVHGNEPPAQMPTRPSTPRTASTGNGDELDIPPFLYPKFKNR
jgi:cell division protein FtsZ